MLDTRPLWNPAIEDLHAEPDFIELLQRLGYVEYWETVGWGDICRRNDGEIVCDSASLTPERLQEILAGEDAQ